MRKDKTNTYRPSSAVEGRLFLEQFCEKCTKRKGCEIQLLTLALEIDDPEYPSEWVRINDKPACTAFDAVTPKN